jgi:hypothetical protein
LLDSSSADPWFADLKVSAGFSGAGYSGVRVVSDTSTCRAAINAFGYHTMLNATARANYFAYDPSAFVVRVVPNRFVVTDGTYRYDGRRYWVVFDSLWTPIEFAL